MADLELTDEQAEKLGAVFSGELGGPMQALGPLIAENLGVERAPHDAYLLDDLPRLEVALETESAGRAKRARERAPDLRAHAHAEAAGALERRAAVETTLVTFSTIEREDILHYLASGEPNS